MSGWEMAAWSLVAAGGLAGSAMFSGLETGFYSLTRVKLDTAAAQGDRTARGLVRELEKPDRLLTTLLIGNNTANYCGSLGLAALLALTGLADWAIILLQAAVLTPVLLVFGESLPKELFRQRADALMRVFGRLITAVRLGATVIGVLPLVLWFARAVGRGAGGEAAQVMPQGRRRVVELIKEGVGGTKVLSEEQLSLVDRATRFTRARVADEMVAWVAARTVRAEWSGERLRRYMARHGHRAYPVLDRSGAVVGVLVQLDALVSPDVPVRELVRPHASLSPGDWARDALQAVSASAGGVGVVFEGGRPVGLATVKDLVEPLTGVLDREGAVVG